MATYKQYSSFNEQWCDVIPSHWDSLRLKRILQERKERNNPIKTDFLLSLTAKQGVVPHSEKEGVGGNKPKDDLTKYNIAHSGDLLVNCMNVVFGAAGVSSWSGAISPVYYALYPRTEDVNIWYYHYIFRLKTFQRSLLGLGKGILMHESDEGVLTSVRMRISMDYLGNVILPIPPKLEQDQIVRYLDWKIGKLNKVISSKRKEIRLLKEQRKAIIDDGILYGFGDTETKDSGIYWLGNIPKDWEVLPLKRIAKVNASIADAVKKMNDKELVTFLPMENVSATGEINNSIKKELQQVKTGYSSFAKGDVVVAKITPCFENGKGADLSILDTPIGFGTTEFINIRPYEKILSEYLYLITMTRPFRLLGEEIMTGSAGQKRISVDYIKNFSLGIPTVESQEMILSKIHNLLKNVDDAIQTEEQNIKLLEELKIRIISDAVTGQIDLSEEYIPEKTAEELDEDFIEDDEDADSNDEEV